MDEQTRQPAPYLYFVGYAHKGGFGGMGVSRTHLADSPEEVVSLVDFVCAEVGINLAVISINRLA